jgi:hypothetical protein
VFLSKGFFFSAFALHFDHKEIALIDLLLQTVREFIHDLILSFVCRQSLLNLGLSIKLVSHVLSLFNFKILKSLVAADFSLSLLFGLPCFQVSVQSIVFLVDLAFELLVNLDLGFLEFVKNHLEIL